MFSVTQRIGMTKQPHGGYIKLSEFNVEHKIDDVILYERENIHPGIIGLVVDYLTRLMFGEDVFDIFRISLKGAERIGCLYKALDYIFKLDNCITDDTIYNAVCLCRYDVFGRTNIEGYDIETTRPDNDTMHNIRTMINRAVAFSEEFGPIIKCGFDFPNGYTNLISSGDGDFLTKDTLWDIKVLQNKPSSKNTLQLIVYLLMGWMSKSPEFNELEYIGFFNPRQNVIYRYALYNISDQKIKIISDEVIGYTNDQVKYLISKRCELRFPPEKYILRNNNNPLDKGYNPPDREEQFAKLDKYMINWEIEDV